MVDTRREQIYNNLIHKETEELLDIWQDQNTDEWEDVVFEIIREILLERLGYLPELSVKAQMLEILAKVEEYLDSNELDKALSECEHAIQMNPDSAISYLYRGDIYKEMRQLENAFADYRKAVELDPQSKDVWKCMKSAESELEDAFEESEAKSYLDKALEYAYDDEPDKALEECEKSKPIMPDLAAAYNYLGLIYHTLDQLESAIDSYLKAIHLNSRFSAAYKNLSDARERWEEEQYLRPSISNQDEIPEDDDVLVENPDIEFVDDDNLAPGWVYLDANACLLMGWAGHRTRPGRSGYDPLESTFERAHMAGYTIRLILTRKFRTQNPFYLGFMALVGIFLCMPCFFLFIPWVGFGLYISSISIFCVIIGIMLLVNVYLSLQLIISGEYEDNGCAFF